jgi:hypothetical protein
VYLEGDTASRIGEVKEEGNRGVLSLSMETGWGEESSLLYTASVVKLLFNYV